jgi:hypothetical protein
VEAPAEALREAILDVDPFMRAVGFDEVTVDGDGADGPPGPASGKPGVETKRRNGVEGGGLRSASTSRGT